MSDELDKKLTQLIFDYGNGYIGIDNINEQIKQAFIDDGWVKVPQVEMHKMTDDTSLVDVTHINGKRVMTREEWEARQAADTSKGTNAVNPSTATGHEASKMTGQEWYDKYRNELSRLVEGSRDSRVLLGYGDLHTTAAKKAAGIES